MSWKINVNAALCSADLRPGLQAIAQRVGKAIPVVLERHESLADAYEYARFYGAELIFTPWSRPRERSAAVPTRFGAEDDGVLYVVTPLAGDGRRASALEVDWSRCLVLYWNGGHVDARPEAPPLSPVKVVYRNRTTGKVRHVTAGTANAARLETDPDWTRND